MNLQFYKAAFELKLQKNAVQGIATNFHKSDLKFLDISEAQHMTFDVIVIGHLTYDLNATSDGRVYEVLGGVAAYAPLVAANLEAVVGVVSKVGRNFKEEYLDLFRASNINILGLKAEMSETTTFENTYDELGRRTQRLLACANPIEVRDIPESYFEAKCFHFGPIFHEVSYDAIEFAHKQGIMTSLDPQGYCRALGRFNVVELRVWEETEETLQHVDILKCDEFEAEKLTGTRNLNRAARLIHSFGPKIVLITQGEHGSILFYGDKIRRIPIFRGNKIVDLTGAGDAYAAGFITEYLRTRDSEHSAHFASCVASFLVEGIGAATSPTRQMVLDRLN